MQYVDWTSVGTTDLGNYTDVTTVKRSGLGLSDENGLAADDLNTAFNDL